MKKIMSLILVLGLCISLCACGGNGETEENVKIEDRLVVGKWVTDHTKMDGRLINYTLTFFSDGSMTEAYYDTALDKQVENVLKWTISENVITVESYLGTGNSYTYTNDNGIEKLMAPQAAGYWYEHVVE